MLDLTVGQLLHTFSGNDDKVIWHKLGLAFYQNMSDFPFDGVAGHSISQFFTDRQTHPKVLLVLGQPVDHKLAVGYIFSL